MIWILFFCFFSISVSLCVLPNLFVCLSQLLLATIDSRLSAAIWAIFLFSFASLLSFPSKFLGIRILIASTILRLIFSIDIKPTLWLLGTIQVVIKAIHLISIMGNHGTFNKSVRRILTDREFLYHICYLAFCVIGLCWHPFCYSVLVSTIYFSSLSLYWYYLKKNFSSFINCFKYYWSYWT